MNTDNIITRHRITLAIGAVGGDDAVNVLADLLRHPDSHTRSNAAIGLGHAGDNRAVPMLIERLGQEIDDDVRAWIITSLGELGDKLATQSIIDVLSNAAQNPRVHSRAIHALSRIRDEAALPALYHEVNNADAWQTRATATSAIAAIGTPYEATNRLFELLGHDHETVRTTAAKDLGYLGARTEDLALRDYIVNNLIQHLQDDGTGYHGTPTVAHMAAKSLYYVGTPEANAALRNWELKQGDN